VKKDKITGGDNTTEGVEEAADSTHPGHSKIGTMVVTIESDIVPRCFLVPIALLRVLWKGLYHWTFLSSAIVIG